MKSKSYFYCLLGVHRKRMPVTECKGGQTASFGLRKVKNQFETV